MRIVRCLIELRAVRSLLEELQDGAVRSMLFD